MEHCLSKMEDLDGDREPLFKYSFSCLRVCVCVFIYFIHVSIFALRYVLFKFITFIIYFVLILLLQNTENSEKENSETKQKMRTKREVNKDKTKL